MARSTFPFTCPHCGHQTVVSIDDAGRTGPCVTCSQEIVLPDSEAAGELARQADQAGQHHLPAVIGIVAVLAAASLMGLIAITLSGFSIFNKLTRQQQVVASCQTNLKMIGLALQTYHDQYQQFPPAYLTDNAGQPMHSWRVLILPYMGYDQLYQQFDLSRPWNDPVNLQVAAQMPTEFACPADPDATNQKETNYLALVGKGTAFEGASSSSTTSISAGDGLATTALIIESPNRGHSWISPNDFQVQRSNLQLDGQAGNPGSSHPLGVHVLLADGTVRLLPPNSSPGLLRAIATRAGGEAFSW